MNSSNSATRSWTRYARATGVRSKPCYRPDFVPDRRARPTARGKEAVHRRGRGRRVSDREFRGSNRCRWNNSTRRGHLRRAAGAGAAGDRRPGRRAHGVHRRGRARGRWLAVEAGDIRGTGDGRDVMTNRREFLKDVAGAAGLVFVGCGVAAAAQSRAASRRRAVRWSSRAGGSRLSTSMRTARCRRPTTAAAIGAGTGGDARIVAARSTARRWHNASPRWTRRASTSRSSASTPTGTTSTATSRRKSSRSERGHGRLLRRACRSVCGVRVASRCSSPISRREQLEDGVKKLGLRGAAVGGSVAGEELADRQFHPVLGEGRGARRASCSSTRRRPGRPR